MLLNKYEWPIAVKILLGRQSYFKKENKQSGSGWSLAELSVMIIYVVWILDLNTDLTLFVRQHRSGSNELYLMAISWKICKSGKLRKYKEIV